ncbi:hypothetical protein ES703_96365 [subsurface metagenome]
MGVTKHDKIAKIISRKKGAEYNPGKGVDIKTRTQKIEVEVDQGKFKDGVRQLQGYRGARYLAVPNELVEEAVEYTKDLKVGVMNEKGEIIKRAG